MKLRSMGAYVGAFAMLAGAVVTPIAANAQSWREHREHQRNQWRDIAAGAGALGLLGLLSHDNTLTFAGGAGALYSLYRYNQDHNSHDRYRRARAQYFDHDDYWRDGHHYVRRTVTRNGQRYYQFVRDDRDDYGDRYHQR